MKKMNRFGKLLSRLFMAAAVFTSCQDDDVAGSAAGTPLQVSVTANSPLVSRAIVTDDYLPDKSSIGLSLFTPQGESYDGQNYNNIKFTAAGIGASQTWTGASEVSLSGNEAYLLAYWPYDGELESPMTLPVETATQTDYMYSGLVTGISNVKPDVDITMNHALTAVRVRLVLGDYTGNVAVSNVSVASPALGTAAECTVFDGALSDIEGQGDAVELDVDFDMTAEGTNTDVMLVPDASVESGITEVMVTIGGNEYIANISFDEAYKQGYIYTYTLTLNNKGFEVTQVKVIPWNEGDEVQTTINKKPVPEPDNEYIVKIAISNDGIEYMHNVRGMTGTIDWGDGTKDTYKELTSWPTHTYSTAGEYTVTVKGDVTELSSAIVDMNTGNPSSIITIPLIKEIISIGKEVGVKSMAFAFTGHNLLDKIHPDAIKGYDGTSMIGAFMWCTSLQSIPEGLFDNCTKVTHFGDYNIGYGTFYECANLTTIPEGLFDKCTEVKEFTGLFGGCYKLISIPNGLFDKCTEVTSFGGAFEGCSGIQAIPEGLFDKNTKVTDFYKTFFECVKLQNIPEGLFDKNTKVTDFGWTFAGCVKLTGESPYTIINVDGVDTKVHLYERASYPEYFSTPTYSNDCFYSCIEVTDYSSIPSNWK